MNTNDITVTQGRLNQAIEGAVTKVVGNKITQQINNAVTNQSLRKGVVTKFYQYLDKAEVELSDSNEKVLCKILHRFGGELIDFYTPTGTDSFCDDLHEPCVIPRSTLTCYVLPVENEWLLLGYEQEELIEINPANQGNMKLVTRGGTNQFWIKFGYDGLDIRSLTPTTMNVGETNDEMTPVEYVTSETVYDKTEVYNKEEISGIVDHVAEDISADINKLIILALGVGVFTVEDNHLFVELPATVSNPFSIENGHLMVEWEGNNPFWIENDKLYYEEVK